MKKNNFYKMTYNELRVIKCVLRSALCIFAISNIVQLVIASDLIFDLLTEIFWFIHALISLAE